MMVSVIIICYTLLTLQALQKEQKTLPHHSYGFLIAKVPMYGIGNPNISRIFFFFFFFRLTELHHGDLRLVFPGCHTRACSCK